MINLPIFRAKKLDSDEYVIGFYEGWEEKHFIVTSPKEFFKIDPATLSIHFPNMLDSQGNEIFASLSEDGKGGDIVKIRDSDFKYVYKYIKGRFMLDSMDMLDSMELMNPYLLFQKIGIQE